VTAHKRKAAGVAGHGWLLAFRRARQPEPETGLGSGHNQQASDLSAGMQEGDLMRLAGTT
jgi:hypothetical protein